MGNFFDGFTATVFRSFLVVVMLLPIALLRHRLQPLRLKENWRYILGMVAASPLTWGPFYYAILHSGVGISLTINYASIVIGQFFFGWLLIGEKFTKDKALSTVLGFLGLMLIFAPSTQRIGWLALVAALVSGLSSAANATFAKQIKYNAIQTTIVWWSTGIVGNMVMVALLHKHYPAFGWQVQWLYLVLFSVASVIASWSMVRGLKLIDVGAAGVLGLLEVVFGVLFGVVLFHEHLGYVVILGVVAIIAAAAIPYVKDYNTQRGTLE